MTAEDLLTRTLNEITEATEYPTTSMSTVVARSRAIRGGGRRRVALLAAAAVVVAGGLSAALLLGHGGDSTPGPAGPLGDLEQGPAPKVDYLDGDTFVTTSGERVTSPAFAKAVTAVRWKNGVLTASRGTISHPLSTISFVSGGATSRVGCGTPSFAVPLDGGDPAYWLATGCRLDRGGELVRGEARDDTPKGALLTPVGLAADGVVTSASSSGLRLPSHALVIPPGGKRWIPLPLLGLRAATEAGNLVTGLGRDAEHNVVVDAGTGQVKWRPSSAWAVGRFSASGRYLTGIESVGVQQSDDVGDIVGIWDAATGHQVLQQALPGLIVDAAAWEGDDSLLVVAEDRQGQEAVLRVGLDGSVTRATSVVTGVPRPAEGRPPLTTLRLAATP